MSLPSPDSRLRSESPGVAVDTHRLIWVTGPDALSFLDGQVSQDVAGMASGAVRRSFLLEPRGKLLAILWVLRGEDGAALVAQADQAPEVMAALQRYRFRVKVELTIDARPGHSCWGTAGAEPGWREAGTALTVVTPAGWSVVFAAVPPLGAVLTPDEFAAHRIAAGEPWFGLDVDAGTIPQETGLVPESVSFTKGCYLGQELVARIDSRGHVNRMLRRLQGSGPPPVTGSPVLLEEREIGAIGSVAPRGDGWVALATLRREAEPGSAVTIGAGAPATVHELRPGGSASQSSNAPRR